MQFSTFLVLLTTIVTIALHTLAVSATPCSSGDPFGNANSSALERRTGLANLCARIDLSGVAKKLGLGLKPLEMPRILEKMRVENFEELKKNTEKRMTWRNVKRGPKDGFAAMSPEEQAMWCWIAYQKFENAPEVVSVPRSLSLSFNKIPCAWETPALVYPLAVVSAPGKSGKGCRGCGVGTGMLPSARFHSIC
ncbi:hypothetical protein BC835DRAFT_1478943 [Cytidiella melzeri]|nr:hypothetical protein BC835DRAFT_1478943 [Cytidiella melzeri]